MDRIGRGCWGVGFAVLAGLGCVPCVDAQTQTQMQAPAQVQVGAAAPFAWGYMPQASLGGTSTGQPSGFMVPMGISPVVQPGARAGTGRTLAADPLGLGYVYGSAAIPMTPGQAGLFMLSTQQRMLGIGNGQISGTRPAGQIDPRTGRTSGNFPGTGVTAAHTRNSNIPGGQASRYFNRGTTSASAAASQPYFKRPLRYFPQTSQ